ncbi:MAG: hypothetical protein HYS05_13810, partial [Acidobacteria bacterium]|nr:hypothetical protein [Acidobacteriota bacterium]
MVKDQSGIALIIVLLSVLLVGAMALGLAMTSSVELSVAAAYRDTRAALYAADAALEYVLQDLAREGDWDLVLRGQARAALVDGPPAGSRNAAGRAIDLTEIVNKARCGKSTCDAADLVGVTESRPWGPNNPIWQLYAYAPASAIVPANGTTWNAYVVVMVADDPSETDRDPAVDGGGTQNPGAGKLVVRASAFGASGAVRTIQATVERA